ncbi:MAG: ATP-binding protein [Polyangiales bacterium]
MLQRLEMVGVGPASKLALDFAPRVNLLTGDNGLGKSFALETAWWMLVHRGRSPLPGVHGAESKLARVVLDATLNGSRRQTTARFSPKTWRWTLGPFDRDQADPGYEPGPAVAAGVAIITRADGSASVWDEARNTLFALGEVATQAIPVYSFTRDEVWDGLTLDGRSLCNGLLRDWVSWQQRGSDEFRALVAALEGLSPTDEPIRPSTPVRLSPTDALDYPAIQLSTGIVPVTHTSAGMQRVLSIAYALVWSVFEHQRAATLMQGAPTSELLLMVDEIEAHLHPRWQRVILPALLRVVKALASSMRVQLIVSTHSPLVLASMEGEFDAAQDALFDFDLVPREGDGPRADVEVRKLDWRARGDANQWLTSEVFDLKQPGSLRREQALERAKAALRQPGLSAEEVREIHRELHAVLGDTDPFWARWEARAKAAGIDP